MASRRSPISTPLQAHTKPLSSINAESAKTAEARLANRKWPRNQPLSAAGFGT